MAIELNEFQKEKAILKETKEKLLDEIALKKKADEELREKIAHLKKVSGGTYNEELELSKMLYEVTKKNLYGYLEVKDNPYFARIDFRETKRDFEELYIGKFGLLDSKDGEPIIIDWRAPIADIYYSGTKGKISYETPSGWVSGELSLKRKFLIEEGELKDAFDEGINEIILKGDKEEDNALTDEFLKINLEKSISSKLKEVVATIQKEQNYIIRSPINGPLIIQGSAGSGKTTVALHRLAYILYKYRNTIVGSDILVLAPNQIFIDYISEVLPSLGSHEVTQSTLEDMLKKNLKIKGNLYNKDVKLKEALNLKDSKEKNLLLNASKLKGSLLFKKILDRFLQYIEKNNANTIEDLKYEEFTLLSKEELKRLYIKDMAHLSLEHRKSEILKFLKKNKKQRILEICKKLEFYYDTKVMKIKREMEDSKERRDILISLYNERDEKQKSVSKNYIKLLDDYFDSWKNSQINALYSRLFFDDALYEEVVGSAVQEELKEYIKEKLKENEKKNLMDVDDLIAMAYIKIKIDGVLEKDKFKHIVIDEAQDYSLLAFEVIKEFCPNNSYTIVGDIGQGIYYYKGMEDWKDLIDNVLSYNASYVNLKHSYRSTVEIIDFASKVLEKQNLDIISSRAILRHGSYPKIKEFKDDLEFFSYLEEVILEVENNNKNSIAIICKDDDESKKLHAKLKKKSSESFELVKGSDKSFDMRRVVIPTYLSKGLEFDAVIVYNADDGNYKRTKLDLKLLYVALTRALHFQYVFYKGNISQNLI